MDYVPILYPCNFTDRRKRYDTPHQNESRLGRPQVAWYEWPNQNPVGMTQYAM
jgi:hypothetical protein